MRYIPSVLRTPVTGAGVSSVAQSARRGALCGVWSVGADPAGAFDCSLAAAGTSLLAAILVLALMILPTVALTSSAALAAVARELQSGAVALGLSRKCVILSVVLPAARSGIISGAILAVVRALGETMAVLMVAGNVVQNPTGLFAPVRVLTANIALEMAYAMGEHRASLFASGLLLTLLVWGLVWAAARLDRRRESAAYV